ncbi:hypothetical protein PoB_003244200 [Plakobranchus ocellatus]|uniref:Uncharacterized protein n=1 Tax=Plakobranchus ocellatus TaxID=259542 RepID=A0AAV4AGA4_9GAST|nr:hypothetical protein PoB_003244200 [Plakobranchus ocellatus]
MAEETIDDSEVQQVKGVRGAHKCHTDCVLLPVMHNRFQNSTRRRRNEGENRGVRRKRARVRPSRLVVYRSVPRPRSAAAESSLQQQQLSIRHSSYYVYIQIQFGLLYIASPQQGSIRLSGPPSGQGAGGGARTRDRRFPADLRADSLATVPSTPPYTDTVTGKRRGNIL